MDKPIDHKKNLVISVLFLKRNIVNIQGLLTKWT